MAQARLERIGTIYTRIQSLLRGGAMKEEDKPLWYTVYAAFPPKQEPTYETKKYDIQIKPLLYEEDLLRAKLHRQFKEKYPALTLNRSHGGLISQAVKAEYDMLVKGGRDPKEAEEYVLERVSAAISKMTKV